MSKLSTSDVKTGGDFTPKNIEPGNVKAKIFKVELDQPPFLLDDKGYFLLLHLETEKPNEEFVGFHTVFGDDSSPTFEGQTGKVKASRWAYKDATTPKGVEISRDKEMMKLLSRSLLKLSITMLHLKISGQTGVLPEDNTQNKMVTRVGIYTYLSSAVQVLQWRALTL
jgi:hypothetical protein